MQSERILDLSAVGVRAKAARKRKVPSRIQRIKAWKPATPAGRKCKAGMLKWAKLPRDPRGVFDYRYGKLCPVNDPAAIAEWYRNRKEAA